MIRYNKAEKDFPTLLEYNNYLEEVEDISEFGPSKLRRHTTCSASDAFK